MTSSAHEIYEVRALASIEHLHGCEAIAKVVWQVDDREIVPASHLRAIQHAGGLVAGAFEGNRLVGFVIGFLARHDGDAETGLHSHLMGVLPEARRAGLGRALKWYQRRWSLERGLPWISWTFDPLQAYNARLNLEQLGAEGVAYHPDFYGTLGGVMFGSLATDRVVARWDLEAPRVLRLAGGAGPEAPEPADDASVPTALAAEPDGAPGSPNVDHVAEAVRLEIPAEFSPLLYSDPERARAWREAVRTTMTAYLARGYRAHRFVRGAYRLIRDA